MLSPGLHRSCNACPCHLLMHTQAPAKKVESSDDSDDDSEEEAPKKAAAKPAAKPAAKAAAKVRSLHCKQLQMLLPASVWLQRH